MAAGDLRSRSHDVNSVNTNVGAMVALQNLNSTNAQLFEVQNRINTGKRIISAKDNGAIWAIAQGQRATHSSLTTVKESLNRAQSTVDVAISAGEAISDILLQMKDKALAASDTSLDTTARSALSADFTALRDQVTTVINNADFNGVNLIKTGATALQALANEKGSKITVGAQIMSYGGTIMTVTAAAALTSATVASTHVGILSTSIANVSAALSKLGTGSKALGQHLNFVSKLQDTIEAGIGNLVDADLAKESARLQSLQTKQQLGIQALSIANSSSQTLLGLFR
ncbi:MAG TPA: flagellin [Phenylobacterium sp.]